MNPTAPPNAPMPARAVLVSVMISSVDVASAAGADVKVAVSPEAEAGGGAPELVTEPTAPPKALSPSSDPLPADPPMSLFLTSLPVPEAPLNPASVRLVLVGAISAAAVVVPLSIVAVPVIPPLPLATPAPTPALFGTTPTWPPKFPMPSSGATCPVSVGATALSVVATSWPTTPGAAAPVVSTSGVDFGDATVCSVDILARPAVG